MTAEEPTLDLQWASFVVDEKPRCMWGADVRAQNQAFLDGIDPAFFVYASDVHVSQLDQPLDQPQQPDRDKAALAIRLHYAQALETFFALLCSAIQAPHCPLGWVLSYRNRDLYSIARKMQEGRPVLTVHPPPLSWDSLSYIIHRFSLRDEAEDQRIKHLFAEAWALLAHEFTTSYSADEYNSIKHGFRARLGGFSLNVGPAMPGGPRIESRSEFGTRSFDVEPLSDDGINFHARDAMRNWSPRALAVRTELAAMSINNIVSYLRLKLGSSQEHMKFQWPEQHNAIDLAWSSDFIFESGRDETPLPREAIVPKSMAEVLELYGQ